MSAFLEKINVVLGSSLAMLYKVLAIFGIVSKDDTTGTDLRTAFDSFFNDIKGVF